MSRVTPAEVKEILETDLTDPQIQSWIDIASKVIDRYAAQCALADSDTLAMLEKLLTAHYISAVVERDKSLTARSFGDSSESYMAVSGEGLKASPYGQQMLALDPCGILIDFGKRRARSWLL